MLEADVAEAGAAQAHRQVVRLLCQRQVEDLGGAAFKVLNPNAASGCGCGSSFSI